MVGPSGQYLTLCFHLPFDATEQFSLNIFTGNGFIPSLNQAGMDDKGNLLDSADLDQDREAWKDLWSAGHGVGSIDSVLSTEELVAQLKQEYRAAIEAFEVNSSKFK